MWLKVNSLDDYLKQRKPLILIVGVALLVGAILKGFVLAVIASAILIYFLLKKMGDKKLESVKGVDTNKKEHQETKY